VHLPAQLRNWQVLDDAEPQQKAAEIESEATLLDVGPAQAALRPSAIQDQIDEIVVAALAHRRIEVTPGEKAALQVQLVNNGAWPALFEVAVEGWIDERWCEQLPLRVQLQPGDRYPVTITLALPREPASQAGDHPLAVVVRSARYPGHVSRVGATLVVHPYSAFTLGAPQPRQLATSWFQRSATLILPLTNQGNHTATFHLQAMDRRRQCAYRFLAGETADGEASALFHVAPGQTIKAPVVVTPAVHPWVCLFPQLIPFRLSARLAGEELGPRSVDGQVACAALVGPWHLAALAVLAVVALMTSGLAGLALLMALRSPQAPASAPAPAPAAMPAASAPIVAFILKVDEPVPTPGAASFGPDLALAQGQSQAPLVQPGDVSEPGSRPAQVAGPPVVRAEQVTAPGESLPPAAQTPLMPPQAPVVQAPDAVPAQPARANMTYAQMFQEVAQRYDLDWQLLAAQAYVESGFDSLALSSAGDMGLMQIRPTTWREWAPAVDASDPFDSYDNVLVAAAYLDHLRAQFAERGRLEQEWMLVAYNWGPDQVLDFLAGGGSWESLDPELRQYALDIQRIAASIPAP
jgi:soluble lytic murein transglycosylase-like protein